MEKGSTKVQTARNSSTSSSSSLSSSTPSSSSISSSNPQKLTAAQTLQNLSLSFQKLKEQSQNSQDTKTLLTKLTELEEEINTFIKQINQIDFSGIFFSLFFLIEVLNIFDIILRKRNFTSN